MPRDGRLRIVPGIKTVKDYPGRMKAARKGEGECDLRSMLDLMILGLARGCEVEIEVEGPDEEAQRDRLVELLRFESTRTEEGSLISLSDYVARMPDDQDAIYYLLSTHRDAAKRIRQLGLASFADYIRLIEDLERVADHDFYAEKFADAVGARARLPDPKRTVWQDGALAPYTLPLLLIALPGALQVLDFAGGKAIFALASTARGGAISRIVPRLAPDATTLTRADVEIVVTEHGAADLRGLSLDARAQALIDIAHPEHRAGLERAWSHMRSLL